LYTSGGLLRMTLPSFILRMAPKCHSATACFGGGKRESADCCLPLWGNDEI